jgi:hypothetical protein
MGVILFVMVTGYWPSHTEASPDDAIYQSISRGDTAKFWSIFNAKQKTSNQENVKKSWLVQVLLLLVDVFFGALII